ncbi:MAG: hypothetical protein WB660_04550 [Candidatus Sulfotelmatobacter sp.]
MSCTVICGSTAKAPRSTFKLETHLWRGGVEHGASAIEDSRVIDVFTPCREDYIA